MEENVFELVGGEPVFRELAAHFYEGVVMDPLLRPMYPDDLEGACERLALFLMQYWGGPTTYSDQRGHPRLRMRHLPYSIGLAERDAWLRHMLAAMDAVGIAEPARSMMLHHFQHTANFMMNRPD